MEGLKEISRKKPIPQNRVPENVEKAVVDMAINHPAYGQLRVSNELKKEGIFISPGVVYQITKGKDKGKYSYTKPISQNKSDRVNLKKAFDFVKKLEGKPMATFHNHSNETKTKFIRNGEWTTAVTEKAVTDEPSDKDYNAARHYGIEGYIITDSTKIIRYNSKSIISTSEPDRSWITNYKLPIYWPWGFDYTNPDPGKIRF